MAEVDKSKKSGGDQAAKKPKKLLANGLDPSVGKNTQFKPGQSGNPAGKPKGTKHINTWIQEIVTDEEYEARVVDPKTWQIVDFKGAPIKAIIMSLVHTTMTHPDYNVRLKAADKLMHYGWPTKNEHTGADGERLVQTPLVISPIQPRQVGEAGDAPAQTEAS